MAEGDVLRVDADLEARKLSITVKARREEGRAAEPPGGDGLDGSEEQGEVLRQR